MIQRKKRAVSFLVIFIISLLIILFISSFIQVPFQIKTYSEVFPKQKWLLTRGKGGEIISNVIDYTQGHTVKYDISNFERGEVVSVDFLNYLSEKKEFKKGDTIVFIKSSEVLNQLALAEGELNVAIADLKAQDSPQKAPLIDEAEARLRYINEKIHEQKILFKRTEQLYQKGLTSQQEFELQQGTYNLLKIEQNISEAQVKNLKTGVKEEDIELLKSRIDAARANLTALRQHQKQHIVISPIEGKIIASYSPDTLLHVSDFGTVVLHVPVKIIDLKEFTPGQTITLSTTLTEEIFKGKVLSVEKEVHLIGIQQVVFISVLVSNRNGTLLPGMILENNLNLRETSLLNQIIRMVTQ